LEAKKQNKAMLARLRAWKVKEVQEKAQQKNVFFVVPSTFMGRELAPCGLFFFAFPPRFFIGFQVWPLLPKIYDDTGLVKVRYAMQKNFPSVSPRVQEILLKRSKVGLHSFQNQI
jgi:hypothetical protein